MKTPLAVPFACCLALAATAQNPNPTIDLGLWTVEHINGTGPWFVDAPRLFTNSTNTVITDSSVCYSDFPVTVLDFRMSVDPAGGDDDVIGFVLGWNPGDSSNATADYVLVDWKKVTQAFQNWGTANRGLALSRVTGTFTRGYGGGPIDLWSHTGNCTELARSTTYGQVGWEFSTHYHFRVIYTPGSVDILVNGVPEFHVAGTFPAGRFGCYNYSQSHMEFQFPLPGAFAAFGNGCQGSAGVPYLFSPETPLVGFRLPIIVANLPPPSPVLLVLGVSNTNWNGTPLPIALGPFGGAGCSAYVSGDIFVPVMNFNGTAYVDLQLPVALPTTYPTFFAQALAIDPAANGLGIGLSNAAAATIGIR